MHWEVVVNDTSSILEAIELQAGHQLSFWDALILQAANHAEVTVVYSENLNAGQRYGQVVVENPLC